MATNHCANGIEVDDPVIVDGVEVEGSHHSFPEEEMEEEDTGGWNRLLRKITRHKPRESKHRYIIPRFKIELGNISEGEQKVAEHQNYYKKNNIQTTKYTILSFLPKNLFEQFHRFANCYFVFVVLLNFVPAIGAIQPILSMVPVIFILFVQAVKDIVEDYGRYKSDALVNNMKVEIYKR